MTYSKTTLAIAACAAIASSSEAFLAPGSRSVSMTAEKSSKAAMPTVKTAAAAVLAAGAVLQGAVFTAPVEAANFDADSTVLVSGIFGSNSAREAAKPNGAKYDIKNQGSFAKQQSADGKGIDYGSPKGTDFGRTAGGNTNVASQAKSTLSSFNSEDDKPSNVEGSNPAKVAEQKARKLAAKGKSVASNAGSSSGSNVLLSGIFGSKDATDAARPSGAKYDIKNQGSFAKKQSADGKGIDYGSPKGTDFGKTAGGNSGVASENKSTLGASAEQKARKVAEKVGKTVSSSATSGSSGNSGGMYLSALGDKANIGESIELGKNAPKLGGGKNWGSKDTASDAAEVAKGITTQGDLKGALKQGVKTWSGKGNAISTPADLATKPFDKLNGLRQDSQQGRETRGDTLNRATASVKDTIKDVNQGGGDQYKGINPEQ